MGDVGWVVFPYPGLAVFGYTSYIFGEKELEYFQGGNVGCSRCQNTVLCFINVCISPIAPDAHAMPPHICARLPGATVHDYSGTIARPIGR